MTLWMALRIALADCSLGLLSGLLFGLLSWIAFQIALWMALWMALWIALLDCSLLGVFGFASSLCLGSRAGVIFYMGKIGPEIFFVIFWKMLEFRL